jgi:hypothetical protein
MNVREDATLWVVTAFAAAALGEARRRHRLVARATALAQRPGASLPEAPGTALLAPAAWQALYGAIPDTPTPPATPPSLRQAVRWLGRLGGVLDRRGDGDPGVTVLGTGFQHRTALPTRSRLMRPVPPTRKHVGKA